MLGPRETRRSRPADDCTAARVDERVGDHVANLLSPFWPVLVAAIARVDFRTFFGSGVVFAVLWFRLGVAIFTFVH